MITRVGCLAVTCAVSIAAVVTGCSSGAAGVSDLSSRYLGVWSPVATPAAVPVPGSIEISDQPSWTVKVTTDPATPGVPQAASLARGALVLNLPGVGPASLVYIPESDQLQLTTLAPVGGRVVLLAEVFEHGHARSSS